ncbi:hypothetical protein EW146_g2182 [Bondarzewia mesenterica]|uniref:Pre-mRNA-splicing factor SYF2 n=1 Tax=Bondarzewia mesenterica TaxID=1095465 RepID=A0A4S4M1Y3_9AGAM|nr:hypothetical protein EW146_g2182 [Bondarzewia mesenterica]
MARTRRKSAKSAAPPVEPPQAAKLDEEPTAVEKEVVEEVVEVVVEEAAEEFVEATEVATGSIEETAVAQTQGKITMEERQAKLAQLRTKMRSSTQANRTEVIEEAAKAKVSARDAARLEKQRKLAELLRTNADAEERGEDVERAKNWEWTIEENEEWEKKLARKARRADFEFHDDAHAARRRYKKDLDDIKVNLVEYNRRREVAMGLAPGTLVRSAAASSSSSITNFDPKQGSHMQVVPSSQQQQLAAESLYRDANSLLYADNKPSEDAIDRVISKINKDIDKKRNFSRKRANEDEGDITYINERNRVFNKKIARYYDKYTAEIRASFERGTAFLHFYSNPRKLYNVEALVKLTEFGRVTGKAVLSRLMHFTIRDIASDLTELFVHSQQIPPSRHNIKMKAPDFCCWPLERTRQRLKLCGGDQRSRPFPSFGRIASIQYSRLINGSMHWSCLSSFLRDFAEYELSLLALLGMEADDCNERAEWISAVKCLSHLPHDTNLTPTVNKSISMVPPVNASDTVYIHMDLNVIVHFTGLFLPWHRWFVAVHERALKEKCGYTGSSPYWNWALDSSDFYNSDFWKDSDPKSGLGGWGDPANDFQVPDGGFRDLYLSYPSPHTLRRNFTLQPYLDVPPVLSGFFPDPAKFANTSFTPAEVFKLINGFAGDYRGFQAYFESFEGAHGAVHEIMGGDLAGTCPKNAPSNCTPGPTWSPNEPLFWMHHAMVDKVWYDWQHKSTSNFWSFFGGSVQAMDNVTYYNEYPNGAPPFLDLNSKMPADGMFPQATIHDVFDTTSGILCYIYE